MKANPLLRLYPRAWRERYGDELQALLSERPLRARDLLDLVIGAVDAHASAGWLASGCWVRSDRFALSDGIRGAAAMIVGSFMMTLASLLFARHGWLDASRWIEHLASPVAIVLMSHVMYLRRQSLPAKVAITGGTLVILVLIR